MCWQWWTPRWNTVSTRQSKAFLRFKSKYQALRCFRKTRYSFLLFFLVRYAFSRRRRCASDHPRQYDHGHNVRCHFQEFWRNWNAENGQLACQRICKTEEQTGTERTGRHPVAKDHRSQTDEPAACGHYLIKTSYRTQGEVSAAKPGNHATENCGNVAGTVDVDTQGVGCFGVFTRRAQSQSPPGMEQGDGQRDQQDEHAVDEQVVIEEKLSEKRDFRQSGDFPGWAFAW